MDKLNQLATSDHSLAKGVVTGAKFAVGTLVTFVVGLVLVVLHVPGVPEAIVQYVGANLPGVVLGVALPAAFTHVVLDSIDKKLKSV